MNHEKGTGKAAELPGDKFELVRALDGKPRDGTETIRKDARAPARSEAGEAGEGGGSCGAVVAAGT